MIAHRRADEHLLHDNVLKFLDAAISGKDCLNKNSQICGYRRILFPASHNQGFTSNQ